MRLGDASLNITDGSHFSPKDDKNGDYRIGTVANMTENLIDIDSCKKISKEDYEMLVKNGCKPKIGDVLFSKDGTVGLSFTFKQNDDIVLLSSIAIITPKENLYSDYCACVLKSPFVFKQIESSKRGTGLRRIILHDLKRFQIPLPRTAPHRRNPERRGQEACTFAQEEGEAGEGEEGADERAADGEEEGESMIKSMQKLKALERNKTDTSEIYGIAM